MSVLISNELIKTDEITNKSILENVLHQEKEVEIPKKIENLKARNCKVGWHIIIQGTKFVVTEIGESRLILKPIDRTEWNS